MLRNKYAIRAEKKNCNCSVITITTDLEKQKITRHSYFPLQTPSTLRDLEEKVVYG